MERNEEEQIFIKDIELLYYRRRGRIYQNMIHLLRASNRGVKNKIGLWMSTSPDIKED